MHKDARKVLGEARRQGFTVRPTTRGHAQVRDPEHVIIAVFSGTPGDTRALRNGIAALRRAGFIWPPRRRKDHDRT